MRNILLKVVAITVLLSVIIGRGSYLEAAVPTAAQTLTKYSTIGQESKLKLTATSDSKVIEKACKKTRYVNTQILRVRKSPSIYAKTITLLSYKTKVTVIATIEGATWVKVKLSDGAKGYINNKYLSAKKPA